MHLILQTVRREHLANCGLIGHAAICCIDSYSNSGNYNAASISRICDFKSAELISIMSKNAEVDLVMAADAFCQDYGHWAYESAFEAALMKRHHISADVMRAEYEDILRFLNADGIQIRSDWRQEFGDFVDEKISGKEPVFKTKNMVPGWRDMVPVFEPGVVYIIAARPSMGKTHLMIDVMVGFESQGANGVCYSLEMPGRNIAKRILARMVDINYRSDWRGISAEKQKDIFSAKEAIISAGYDFVSNVTISQLEADATVRSKSGQLDYIMIDHLGLLDGVKSSNANERVTEVSRRIVLLSKRLNVPVIQLCQLSRAVETRGGSKRPALSDLRDSGSLEQDADCVTFIYRPEYYGISEDENGNSLYGIAELIVAKNRDDITGTSLCGYNAIKGFFCTEYDMRNYYQRGLSPFSIKSNDFQPGEGEYGLPPQMPEEPAPAPAPYPYYSQSAPPVKRGHDEDVPF